MELIKERVEGGEYYATLEMFAAGISDSCSTTVGCTTPPTPSFTSAPPGSRRTSRARCRRASAGKRRAGIERVAARSIGEGRRRRRRGLKRLLYSTYVLSRRERLVRGSRPPANPHTRATTRLLRQLLDEREHLRPSRRDALRRDCLKRLTHTSLVAHHVSRSRTPRPPSRGTYTPQSYPLVCRGVPGGSWRTFRAAATARGPPRASAAAAASAFAAVAFAAPSESKWRKASSAPSTPRRYARRLQCVPPPTRRTSALSLTCGGTRGRV